MQSTPFNRLLKIVSIICIAVSAVVLFGWIFQFYQIVSPLPGSASMKANTALGFLFLGFSGMAFSSGIDKGKRVAVAKALVAIVGLLGILTLFEYIAQINLGIDDVIVEDSYSKIIKSRMSPATASCFILLAAGLLLIDKRPKNRLTVQSLWLLVMVVSFISIVTYILNIPAQEKTVLFSSMAIHTSGLFFSMASALFFTTNDIGFAALITGKLPGSKITRQLLPFIISLPIILGYIFLFLSVNSSLNVNNSFWIIINTITLILLTILYISILALRINKDAIKQNTLQQNLLDSNQNLSSFQEAINSMSMVLHLAENGTITEVNAKFSELTQYKQTDIEGANYFSLIANADKKARIESKINKHGFWEGELEFITNKETPLWVYVYISKRVNSPLSSKAHCLVVQQDISARKEIEELKASQFIKKLQQKNQELEQFAYIASHDLQEPLRSLKSIITLLKIDLKDKVTPKTEEFFGFIDSSATRMTDLIKGLMDYARLGGEKKLETADLNVLLQDVHFDIKDRIEREKGTLIIGKMPTLKVYPTETRLLFQNLISNAIKFKKPDIDPIVEIKATEEENFWKFEVKDNGIGIKERQQKKVFVIFQRLHKREDYEGTGIGLAHCKKIVTMHGGEIWVESEFGVGSSFFFTLPKKQFNF